LTSKHVKAIASSEIVRLYNGWKLAQLAQVLQPGKMHLSFLRLKVVSGISGPKINDHVATIPTFFLVQETIYIRHSREEKTIANFVSY